MEATHKTPVVPDHSEDRRRQILRAAMACFARRGFHLTTMNDISADAQISVGLIYRYFENKNAIILAIIEQQLTVARRRIRELHSSENLSKRILDYFNEREPGDDNSMNTALYMEISAQATRDPQIAKALQSYDVTVCSELGDWLRRSKEDGGCGLPETIVPARALLLLCLIEGLKRRGPRGPALDRRMLKKTLDEILVTLVTQPT